MKKTLFASVLFSALILSQTVTSIFLPVWTGTRLSWVRVGSGLRLDGDVLSVSAPARTETVLVYSTSAAGWPLPAGARDVVIYANGLRYRAGLDYTIQSGVVKASSSNMLPEFSIVAEHGN